MTEQIVRRSHELGLVRERLGRREQALESFARSHELDGKYLPNLLAYGHALIHARRWPEALAIHQALLLQRTAVTDEGERILTPGTMAGFPAGSANGHHLVNRGSEPGTYLEIGTRARDDDVIYSDIDLQLTKRDGQSRFTRKTGEPP